MQEKSKKYSKTVTKSRLPNYLHFRSDSIQYLFDCYLKMLGSAREFCRILCKLPGVQKLMGGIMRRKFDKLARTEHGTIRFIEEKLEDHIDAYWGSRKRWEALPEKLSDMEHFTDWDTVVPIDHGYDETKPESELTLEDMQKAAAFRGGKLLSTSMEKGDWRTKLEFECAFGHCFQPVPVWCWRAVTGVTNASGKAGTTASGPRWIRSLPRSGIPFTTRTSCGNIPKRYLNWMFSSHRKASRKNMYMSLFACN